MGDSPHSFGSGLLSLFIYRHSFDFCFSDCFSRPKTSLFTHIFKVAFSSQYFKVPDLIQNGFYHSHPPNHPPPLPRRRPILHHLFHHLPSHHPPPCPLPQPNHRLHHRLRRCLPIGLTTKTYTITQTCATPSGALPEHFITTTKVCDACAGKPTLTVTCPIETAAATATGNATSVVAVPTGTAGCGSGGSCPAGGNGTVIYVTAGAEGRFVTGLEVLVLGAMVGAASSILLL